MNNFFRVISIFILLFIIFIFSLGIFYQTTSSFYINYILSISWFLFNTIFIYLVFYKYKLIYLIIFCGALLICMLWWFSIKPTNNSNWESDVEYITTGKISNNIATLYHVRNFRWIGYDKYKEAIWETRTYNLDDIESLDIITSNWGITGISHVMLSFGFKGNNFITFNIAGRFKKGQKYSVLASFFKNYELSMVAADERDALALRTNIRGEKVHIYRININKEPLRELFIGYINESNRIAKTPKFYNTTITANCTTYIYKLVKDYNIFHINFSLFLTDFLPKYLYDQKLMQPKLKFSMLKKMGYISNKVSSINDKKYSVKIRQNVPGWENIK